jgi:NAD(P)-dependent dehydrogenase (short-subunit alcohol dehydrogenase family)
MAQSESPVAVITGASRGIGAATSVAADESYQPASASAVTHAEQGEPTSTLIA